MKDSATNRKLSLSSSHFLISLALIAVGNLTTGARDIPSPVTTLRTPPDTYKRKKVDYSLLGLERQLWNFDVINWAKARLLHKKNWPTQRDIHGWYWPLNNLQSLPSECYILCHPIVKAQQHPLALECNQSHFHNMHHPPNAEQHHTLRHICIIYLMQINIMC